MKTGVGMTKTGIGATKTMAIEPQTVFWVAGKIVPAVRNIFSFAQTMVSGIKTVVWVIQTVFTMT